MIIIEPNEKLFDYDILSPYSRYAKIQAIDPQLLFFGETSKKFNLFGQSWSSNLYNHIRFEQKKGLKDAAKDTVNSVFSCSMDEWQKNHLKRAGELCKNSSIGFSPRTIRKV